MVATGYCKHTLKQLGPNACSLLRLNCSGFPSTVALGKQGGRERAFQHMPAPSLVRNEHFPIVGVLQNLRKI